MLKVFVLYLQSLTVELYIAFMQFVLKAIASFPVIGEKFGSYVEKMQAAYDHLNTIYLKHDRVFYSQAVQKADTERDLAFRVLRDAIKTATLLTDEAKKTAAEILLKVIELYGGAKIIGKKNNAESAVISNLIEDLEEKYSAQVELLNIGGLVEDLKAKNQAFIQAQFERTEYDAKFGKDAMIEARKRLNFVYRSFVSALNFALRNGAVEELRSFVNILNTEICKYRIYTGQGQPGASGDTESSEEEELEEEVEEEETTDGEQGSETTEPTFTAKYMKGQYVWMEQQYAAGDRIVPPAEPEAFRRVDVPEFMPDHDITIYAQYVG